MLHWSWRYCFIKYTIEWSISWERMSTLLFPTSISTCWIERSAYAISCHYGTIMNSVITLQWNHKFYQTLWTITISHKSIQSLKTYLQQKKSKWICYILEQRSLGQIAWIKNFLFWFKWSSKCIMSYGFRFFSL